MIRERHKSGLEGDHNDQKLIKRRFIPVELSIDKNGQYLTFKKKIPYQVRKVIGLIITYDAPTLMILRNLIYTGSGPNIDISPELIFGLKNELKSGDEASFSINVPSGEKLYFAQPKRLGEAILTLNGYYGKFKSPITLLLSDECSGVDESYYVWESKYSGLGQVELCIKPDEGDNEGEDDDHDEDDDY